jgi:hypothetical protein
VTLSSAGLARAAELFAAPRPAGQVPVSTARPQLCASAAALARGEFTMVLGELHAMWPTLDQALFTDQHPEKPAARGRGRRHRTADPAVLPGWCAQFSPRLAHAVGRLPARLHPEPGADPAGYS